MSPIGLPSMIGCAFVLAPQICGAFSYNLFIHRDLPESCAPVMRIGFLTEIVFSLMTFPYFFVLVTKTGVEYFVPSARFLFFEVFIFKNRMY